MYKLPTLLISCCLLTFQVNSAEILLPVIADATIRKDLPDKNLSHQPNARADDNIITERHAYFKFDTSQLVGLDSQNITSARVFFYLNFLDGLGEVNFMSVDSGWDETTLTWNNAPAALNFIESKALTVADEGKYFSVDITGLVKSWVDGAPNNGIAILPTIGTGVIARIASKENSDISANAYISVNNEEPIIKRGFLPEVSSARPSNGTIVYTNMFILNTSPTDSVRVNIYLKNNDGSLFSDDNSINSGVVYEYYARYWSGHQALDYTESEQGVTVAFTLLPSTKVYIAIDGPPGVGFGGYGIIEYQNIDVPTSDSKILAVEADRFTRSSDGQRHQKSMPLAGGNLF